MPLEITFEFDNDRARRCVRLGETLYITGGQIIQYDGEGVAEVGFHAMPYRLRLVPGARREPVGRRLCVAPAAPLGQRARRARALELGHDRDPTVAAGAGYTLIAEPYNLTLKFGTTTHIPQGVRAPVAEELYRSIVNAGARLADVHGHRPQPGRFDR